MNRSLLTTPALLLLVLAACGKSGPTANRADAPAEPSTKPVIMTTFYPTMYFAQRIGGDHVHVSCPVPDDQDAIFWQPGDADIEAYQQADLIIVNGAEFEKWVTTASLPESRVVDTAAALPDPLITFESVTHSHGLGGAHTHEGIDGHTWVDPVNARIQAQAIRDAMIAHWPRHEAEFRAGFDALAADLGGLSAELARITPRLLETSLLCSHPAYNYVARRHGWPIVNLALDPEAPHSDHEHHEIDHALEGLPTDARRVLLWESDPLPETITRLENDFGIRSVVFSPCELLGADAIAAGEDYLSVMRANLRALEASLE